MIETLKDLESLLKLCRKQGVTEVVLPTVSFKLGEPPKKKSEIEMEEEEEPVGDLYDTPLTPEELVFMANGGRDEENPYKKVGN